MSRPPRILLLLAAQLVLASCATEPVATGAPPSTPVDGPAGTRSTRPDVSGPPGEVPFAATAWPATGSACGSDGFTGLLGRIETPNARTVRFTLCEPDGAFLARIAHPALGILDTATIERLAADPESARSLAGTGLYRIDRWVPGEAVILVRADPEATTVSRMPTVVLRWAADASERAAELQSAAVDAIDAPRPSDVDRFATLPELAVVPRTGLATAYLAFGAGSTFDDVRVRRAFAAALDRDALAASAFPAGSAPATHLVPCSIDGACTGEAWYEFNAPAAVAALAAARFDLDARYTLHVPDQPVPGLPDPLAAAAAIQAQLETNLGLRVTIEPVPVEDLAAGVAGRSRDWLFLAGVASDVADPATFLAPLFGRGVDGLMSTRADGVRKPLAEAAASGDPVVRSAAFGRANDAIRSTVPLVPLVHPGSVVAYRSDVADLVASPLGIDPLGAATPGDRRQVVFMQATEPAGAWCGAQAPADGLRLCALVTEGLYGVAPGTLTIEPRLAERCVPDGDTTAWTCTLRRGVTFHDGARLDAGDVLATYVAAWDAAGRVPTGDAAPISRLFGSTRAGAPDQR